MCHTWVWHGTRPDARAKLALAIAAMPSEEENVVFAS